MSREAMEAEIEATWPGQYSPRAVRCYCRVFINGEGHNWLRPHAQIPGLCVPKPRPWWWCLALGIAIGLTLLEAWIAYRAMVGWPVGVSLLSRIAG